MGSLYAELRAKHGLATVNARDDLATVAARVLKMALTPR
jgi:hypothetical protein